MNGSVTPFPGALARGFYHDVGISQLGELPDSVRFIDVRETHEFDGELGHLERAELVPLGTLEQAVKDWPRDAPFLMICRSGNRSGQAANRLTQLGFSNVANLVGGMLAVRSEEN